jgi:hypothetical protein
MDSQVFKQPNTSNGPHSRYVNSALQSDMKQIYDSPLLDMK